MDLAEKYNIQNMKTYDDYEKFLQTIKESEKGIMPAIINGSYAPLFSILQGLSDIRFLMGAKDLYTSRMTQA
jgi:hypothetical protein